MQEEQKVILKKYQNFLERFNISSLSSSKNVWHTAKIFVINFVNEDCEMMLTKLKVISLFRRYYSLSVEITKRKVFVYARLLRLQQTCDTQNMN